MCHCWEVLGIWEMVWNPSRSIVRQYALYVYIYKQNALVWEHGGHDAYQQGRLRNLPLQMLLCALIG